MHHRLEKNFMPPIFINDSKKSIHEDMPPYTETILKSTVSQSITHYLGGPVTQPSTMVQLRQEATVYCRFNMRTETVSGTWYRNSFNTCNVTECLFDIETDPCEMKNIIEQSPRVRKFVLLTLNRLRELESK